MRTAKRREIRRLAALTLGLALAGWAAGCGQGGGGGGREGEAAPGAGPAGEANSATGWEAGVMELRSGGFQANGFMAARHTCAAQNLSPPLEWSGAPAGTQAFALVCEDPDAPRGTWDHWLIWNLPATRLGLPEGVPTDEVLPDGSRQGRNSGKKTGYSGPCPPPGDPHRYVFRVYALSTPLDLPAGATKSKLLEAMQGRVLGAGTLVGLFGR
jgi:hypothetical protein